MCGICGIISDKKIDESDKRFVEQMNQTQQHRGPDDEGCFVHENIALGHRRLSIFDLSAAGHQPMQYMDKYVITYNGEIYNFMELKEELSLEGYSFRTNTDTEVIMAAYDKWGVECLHKFNGFWAFALYEVQTGRVFMARDRFGVKPLHYTVEKDKIYFSSEIKALLCNGKIKAKANDRVVLDYLINGLVDFTDETFFEGIYRLPAGSYMLIDSDMKRKIVRYYDIGFSEDIESNLTNEQIRKFREEFDKSINLRLRADVPVGSCLSGGLDSSSIVCHVSENLKSRKSKNKQDTFSACYKNFRLDEKKYIDEVAKEADVNTHYIYPTGEGLKSDFLDLVYHQEEPFGTASIYASYCVMRAAKENGTVVLLDGQGADEILCGYRKSRAYYLKILRKNHKYIRLLKESFFSFSQIRTSVSIKEDLSKIKQIFLKTNKTGQRKYLEKDFAKRELAYQYGIDKNFMYNDFYKISLPSLLRFADRNSMAFSIEDRLPFLDFHFVEYCAKLPISVKLKNGYSKYIMRKSLKMPEIIRKRKDKIGFATPDDRWIAENSEYFLNIFKNKDFRAKRYIDNKKIVEDWNSILQGKEGINLFRYICLETWMQTFCVE